MKSTPGLGLPRALALAAALAGCGGSSVGAGLTAGGTLPAHRASLELFVMSQCPYGVQVEQAASEVKDQLGDALDVKVFFIGDGEAGALKSMHGPNEVKGDIVQACVANQAPEKLIPFLDCQNEDYKSVHTNWESCGKSVGLDAAALTACVDGEQGQALVAASFAEAKKRNARSSPTLYLDGQPYQSGRKPRDLLREICKTYGDDAPVACADLPQPPKVDAILLSDERCAECDLEGLEPRIRSELPGLNPTYVDYGTEEGKRLFAELQAADPAFKTLPAVLLSKNARDDEEGFASLERFTQPIGEYIHLKVGGKWDPTAEICDNAADDDGDGLADCADDGCTGSLLCREAMPGKVDLFVMSRCPFGAKAMIAADEVSAAFGDTIDLEVHFIGNEEGGKLSSMHGQAEVDDDIREICAQHHYPDNGQYLDFLACHSRDYKSSDWQKCATEAKMDPAVLEACFAAEGPELLRASFARAAELSITASPTFLVNNRRKFNAVAAGDLQKQICKDNPDLAACATPIVSAEGATASAPAGSCD